jgi:hypothetical protein
MFEKKRIAFLATVLAAGPALAQVEPNVCVARHISPVDQVNGQVVFTCLKKVDGTDQKTIQQMYEAGYRIVSATQTIKSGSTMDTYTTLFLERSVGTGK